MNLSRCILESLHFVLNTGSGVWLSQALAATQWALVPIAQLMGPPAIWI